VFPNPDVFDMHREFKVDGLGYGYGPHRCIAEHLARAELEAVFSMSIPLSFYHRTFLEKLTRVILGTLFQRLPNLRLGVPFDQVAYSPLSKDVGITELPVVW